MSFYLYLYTGYLFAASTFVWVQYVWHTGNYIVAALHEISVGRREVVEAYIIGNQGFIITFFHSLA